MLQIGVQTKNVVNDREPDKGFAILKKAGFACADFSLNGYLLNSSIYKAERNDFFNRTVSELEDFFRPHKQGAKMAGIVINQMHMPYPIYVPNGNKELNAYLWNEVAPKSMQICSFLECPHMVIHGFKLARLLGSEEVEWQQTEKFLDFLAPMAKEMGITLCIENLYESIVGHLVEGPCCNVHKVVERIDRFNTRYGAEVLGFCFDTGHANLVGLDMEKFITTLGHRLKILHIHDNDGIGDLHQIPYTFTKTRENKASTDWDGFLRGLKTIKYNGVLSFETAPVLSAFPEAMKEDVLRFIASIGEHFAKIVDF
ncbi:MAG: sugar phosphate isomerase/epimerase [Lachnospiraceae bacterium]|nr:sugar phosphate isomerase/epimerase [Lachnospiraceae bacterium]